MQIIPARLVLRHWHDGVDRLAGLDGQHIDHRLAERLRCRLRKPVAFQLIDHAAGREEENRRVRIGNEKPRHEILVTGLHPRPALAASALRTIDGQWHALDIAAMADGDDHVLALDQVFVVLVDKLVRNLRSAVVSQTSPCRFQLFENDLVDPLGRTEYGKIVGNLFSQLACLVCQLLALHTRQALKPEFENGTGLGFRKAILPVDNLMARIVDEGDESLHFGGRPGPCAQLVSGRFGIRSALDQFDDFVNRSQRHHEACQKMRALACLAEKMDRPPRHHFAPEFAEGGDDVLQPHLFRAAAIHGKHVHRKTGLQPRMAPQLVQHHVARGIPLDFDDDPHPCPVGFVADVGNAFDGFLADKLADTLQKLCLVHLIRDFVDNDCLAVAAVGDHLGPRPHDHGSAPRAVGVANAGASHDQGAGREIRPRNDLDQLFDGDVRIPDIGLAGGDDLRRVVRRHICRHADRDAVGAVDQKVRIFGRQNRRLKLRLVIILGEIDRILVDIPKKAFSGARQS